MLTAETLRTLLHYDPATGVFTWRRRPEKTKYDRIWNTRFAGQVAGNVASRRGRAAYRVIGVQYRPYLAHRLAWLYMTGLWPSDQTDHRDGNGLNNVFMNLRAATNAENARNGRSRSGVTGLKGAYRDKKRFKSELTVNGAKRHLGNFDTAEEAHAAYAREARQQFGEFARVS
jgi:hypothetical protein